MSVTGLAIIVIVVTGLMALAMLLVVQTFGRYTKRIVESNARTRSSCDASAARASRSEARMADSEAATIELVREMMKSTSCRERSA